MKQNVLFVIHSMATGGISTSLVNLIEYLDKTKKDEFNFDLLVFAKNPRESALPNFVNILYANKNLQLSATPFYDVLKSKKCIDIAKRILLMIKVRIVGSDRFYRAELKKIKNNKKYDAAVSYSNDLPCEYFNQGASLYISDYVEADERVYWLHNDPVKLGFDRNYCEKAFEKIDRIICVSEAVRNKLVEIMPELSKKTEVFYNRFDAEKIMKQAMEYIPFEKKDIFNIVTVCRIDNASKRTDGIVHLCARLKKDGVVNFKWRIVGGGHELKQNIALASKLDVLDVVEFVGEKKNPNPYILHSDLFALYSAYEGHPMVIGEAISVGTYVLTTEYAAAKEQVHKEHGEIAFSDEEFYQKIKTLISSKKLERTE